MQLLVQLSFPGKFEHEKYALLIVEVAMHSQDIRMSTEPILFGQYRRTNLHQNRNIPQVALNLNFSPQLLLNLSFHQLFLVQTFKCDDEFGLGSGPCHVDPSELSLSQRSTNLEGTQSKSRGTIDCAE